MTKNRQRRSAQFNFQVALPHQSLGYRTPVEVHHAV
jgi:hypothetical protein